MTDEKWGAIASGFVDRMGFGDEGGTKAACRWVAVRHGVSTNGNDHVHIAVNLVREDGTKAGTWRDFQRAQAVTRDLERVHGLQELDTTYASRGIKPGGAGGARPPTGPQRRAGGWGGVAGHLGALRGARQTHGYGGCRPAPRAACAPGAGECDGQCG